MIERLSSDYFADGERIAQKDFGAIQDRRRALVEILNEEVIDRTNRRETTAPVDFYIDPVNGSDSNDGLSISRPVRTNLFLASILPWRIRHEVNVHFAEGNYDPLTIFGMDVGSKIRSTAPLLSFIGATGLKTLTTGDNQGTASAGGRDYIDKPPAAADWTPDEMKGELCKLVGGTGSPATYLISSNTTTRIYLRKQNIFGTPFNNTTQFEIHERLSKFNANQYGQFGFGAIELLGLNSVDTTWNFSDIILQNFHVFGGGYLDFGYGMLLDGCKGDLAIENFKFDQKALPQISGCEYLRINNAYIKGEESGFQYWVIGRCGSVNLGRSLITGGGLSIGISRNIEPSLYESELLGLAGLRFNDCTYVGIFTSILDIEDRIRFDICRGGDSYSSIYRNSPGDGLEFNDMGNFYFFQDNISDCAGNAIKAVKSKIVAFLLTGSGNGGYGVKLENGAFLVNEYDSDLTGTLGDIKPGDLPVAGWADLPKTDPVQLVRAY